jgi:hypothetical protein
MGETKKTVLRVRFDRSLKLEFHGSKVRSDADIRRFSLGDAAFANPDIYTFINKENYLICDTSSGQPQRVVWHIAFAYASGRPALKTPIVFLGESCLSGQKLGPRPSRRAQSGMASGVAGHLRQCRPGHGGPLGGNIAAESVLTESTKAARMARNEPVVGAGRSILEISG